MTIRLPHVVLAAISFVALTAFVARPAEARSRFAIAYTFLGESCSDTPGNACAHQS